MIRRPLPLRASHVLLGALALLATLAACSRPQTAEVSTSAANTAIVGGQDVTKLNAISSRVVFITGINKTNGDAEFCTGSLLPGNLVLTAAHCLDDIGDQLYVDFGLSFPISQDLLSAAYAHRAIARRKSPAYDKASPEARRGLDLAILKFAGALPKSYGTFSVPDETSTALVPQPNEQLTLIGYGHTNALVKDEGSLRTLTVSAARLSPDPETGYWQLDGTSSGVCFGDSGGPLVFMSGGQPQIIGVSSRVATASMDSGPNCTGEDIYTRLGPQLKWIQQTMRELANVTE